MVTTLQLQPAKSECAHKCQQNDQAITVYTLEWANSTMTVEIFRQQAQGHPHSRSTLRTCGGTADTLPNRAHRGEQMPCLCRATKAIGLPQGVLGTAWQGCQVSLRFICALYLRPSSSSAAVTLTATGAPSLQHPAPSCLRAAVPARHAACVWHVAEALQAASGSEHVGEKRTGCASAWEETPRMGCVPL
jgi:hypothetical protein